jgi:hypothetical protein
VLTQIVEFVGDLLQVLLSALSMIIPPSGVRLYPVRNYASLLARNSTTGAMSSSGDPSRASGVAGAEAASAPYVFATGRTLFTVILSPPHSRAATRVRAHRLLGHSIGRIASQPNRTGARRKVDDARSLACLQVSVASLHHPQISNRAGLKLSLQLLNRQVHDRRMHRGPIEGIVDQNIDLSERGYNPLERRSVACRETRDLKPAKPIPEVPPG